MALHDIRFGLHLTFSASLYIGILVINGIFVNVLRTNEDLASWFLPYLGILLFSTIIYHLVSAILLLLEKRETVSVKLTVGLAVLHILQLGLLWRHVTVFREKDSNHRTVKNNHLNYLHLVFTFLLLLPLLLVQSFIIIHFIEADWICLATAILTFIGTIWFLASVRITKRHEEYERFYNTISGAICRLLWRGGEIISRILCLVLFASIYFYWIFLMLGLHGVIIFICLCTNFGMFDKLTAPKPMNLLVNLMLSYVYVFCFINFDEEHNTYRHTFYYLVMCLENILLTLVWYLHADDYTSVFHKNIFVLISSCAFILGMTSLIIYRKCFQSTPLFDAEKEHIYETDGCINCKLSLCSKHSIKKQRPFSAGYVSQYQHALSNGQYFKNILEDKFIDSETESNAQLLNSSGEHWHIRDTDLESMRTIESKQYTAVQASGTYTHKRFFDSNSSIARMTDTDSISSGSGVYEKDWRQNSDTILSQLSALDALSLVSSRTHLLTDSWDNLIQQETNNSVTDDTKHPKKIDILNSLIKKDHDTSFFSDGYTTDHTLDSYQLPVTVLAKKRLTGRRKIEPAYSTASDSTDCTICAFMRQNQSSPEESRRNFPLREKNPIRGTIPEEPRLKISRKSRREYYSSKSANRLKNHVQKLTDIHDKDIVSSHKYEKACTRQKRRELIRVIDSTSKNNNHQIKMPHRKQTNLTLKADYSSSVADTSLDENNVHIDGRTGDFFPLEERKGSNSVVFSDSEDSAFPRNTPVSDWSDSTHTCRRDKDIHLGAIRDTHKVGKEKFSSSCNRPSEFPTEPGLSGKPLREYLAATDNDKDGTSESSCEMII